MICPQQTRKAAEPPISLLKAKWQSCKDSNLNKVNQSILRLKWLRLFYPLNCRCEYFSSCDEKKQEEKDEKGGTEIEGQREYF